GHDSLNWAAWFGRLDTTRVLLERGANINTFDGSGQGPLHCAAQRGHIELIKFLLQHGAALEVRDKEGRT
ncbi:ankyrin, partial [Schizophyllum commune Loenen D]